jgi:hypothetical protein
MRPISWLLPLVVFAMRTATSAAEPAHEILMTYWSDDITSHPDYPLPGSVVRTYIETQSPRDAR